MGGKQTLKIDTEVLRTAGESLRTVHAELDRARASSRDIDVALGHHKLTEQLHTFADGWDDTRAKMLQSIHFLAEAASAAGKTFEDVERELARALNP